MKNTFGNSITLTLFGESHGDAVGVVIDGIAPGLNVNDKNIEKRLSQRRPFDCASTGRVEPDKFSILSGVKNGKTTGAPICIVIPNECAKREDYDALCGVARPGHCDYPAFAKYHGFEDQSGGGHFSGRLTAAIVAAGSIFIDALKEKNIFIGTHLKKCAGVCDRDFDFDNISKDFETLENEVFPVLSTDAGDKMRSEILKAKNDGDSVGGVLETAICGIPAGVGEPWFDSIESTLAHALFSIPAVKGVEFGDGFSLADKLGSEAADEYRIENGKIVTSTNRMGGIGGGITNGMPIVFRCAVKPTPSIEKTLKTVDFVNMKETEISVKGRHDACIAPRARAVVDALAAFTVADLLTMRFGTDFLR